MASHLVKDTIVCLADLERATTVTVEEVLGLVSELKEERDCKVVLIFNADRTAKRPDMRNAYPACKETAIHVEVVYAPSVEEAFSIACPGGFPAWSSVLACVEALGITSIRIPGGSVLHRRQHTALTKKDGDYADALLL